MNDEQSREENRVDAPISPADSPDAPAGPNLTDPNGTENQERPQEVVEAEQEGATDLDDRLGNETGEDDEE
jgi:hypothetical protein